MAFEKRVPDEFGLIVPKDNNMFWIKQGGGMSPKDRKLEGVYVPIGEMEYNLGYPDWAPEGPNFEEKITKLDVNNKPPIEDRQRIPAYIRERGHFLSSDEYLNWIEDTEVYGSVSLWKDLYRFTYGLFDMLESDPRERWDSEEELWSAINESFPFTYEHVKHEEYVEREDLDGYPWPEAAIRPIRIKDSKESRSREAIAPWADELSGDIVFLMCPNAE